MQLHDIQIRIKVPNHSMARCSCTGCFRYLDCWVSAGAILRRRPGGTHHAYVVSLDGRVLGGAALDLRVVFE
jgi:hypothetical protein